MCYDESRQLRLAADGAERSRFACQARAAPSVLAPCFLGVQLETYPSWLWVSRQNHNILYFRFKLVTQCFIFGTLAVKNSRHSDRIVDCFLVTGSTQRRVRWSIGA